MGLFLLTLHGSSHVFTSYYKSWDANHPRLRVESCPVDVGEIPLGLWLKGPFSSMRFCRTSIEKWMLGNVVRKKNALEMWKRNGQHEKIDNVIARIVGSFVLNSLGLLYMMMPGR